MKLQENNNNVPLGIVVIGASGDLAVKKIFPALFALYSRKLLPETFKLYGYARTPMDDIAFRTLLQSNLTCRYAPDSSDCQEIMASFLGRCHYISGQYDSTADFCRLGAVMDREESGIHANRLFYFSIPPFLFQPLAETLHAAGLLRRDALAPWHRVVIEKPFGRDRASSDQLTQGLAHVFSEEQTYRIDHYLGKEVIQNLMVLRFANLVFEPIWNRSNIAHVQITWMEDIGLEGRAGYFDAYGIIRDVMQNHLLQILALVAMEEPVSLNPEYVRNEKVKTLRSITPLSLNDVVVGQYSTAAYKGKNYVGYLEEPGIPPNSITPTYAAVALKIRNRRWDGIPFLMRAGKGLNGRKTEIRIAFRDVPANIFGASPVPPSANDLVIQVQPDPGIALHIMTKVPGLGMKLQETRLNLSYASEFATEIPDAYESLLLDVIKGDKSMFIRADELEAAWDVFTPLLNDLESCTVRPQPYRFGSSGPDSAAAMAAYFDATWD